MKKIKISLKQHAYVIEKTKKSNLILRKFLKSLKNKEENKSTLVQPNVEDLNQW